MKRLLFVLLIVLSLTASAQTAKIKIDIDREIGEVDSKIYGVFMEPIQFDPRRFGRPGARPSNTMYGSLYDPESELANEDGFRTDYIEAAKELKLTNMRWPGGNFVAGYNWQDGIGPKDKRPVRKELAWGALENNHVGTDEWVKLNKACGTENVVCINLGTGTIDDARYWVEYCNCEKGSYYADLRAEYGNEEPYGIKYWCLGNEVDGEPWILGYKNAEDYCKFAREAAKVMRKTDPGIVFIANGSSNYGPDMKWVEWNWKVINEFRDDHKRDGDFLDFKGGLLRGEAIELETFKRLATLPGREELIAKLMYLLKYPITGLVSALSDLPRKLVYALGDLRSKWGGEEPVIAAEEISEDETAAGESPAEEEPSAEETAAEETAAEEAPVEENPEEEIESGGESGPDKEVD